MPRILAMLAVLLLCVSSSFGIEPTVATANGAVVKANAEVLIVRPRGADGKFEKALTLKIRGTTKVTVLTFRQNKGETVPVQREVEVKDLHPEQVVSVIYTNAGDALVLLSAVALPAAKEK
jgi:hypothetical protein